MHQLSGRDARSLNLQRPPEPIQPISEAQPTRLVGKLRAIFNVCRTSTFPTDKHFSTCGSELARESGVSGTVDVECADAFASKLAPTGFCGGFKIGVHKKRRCPSRDIAFVLPPLKLIPAVCTQSRSHPSWCPANRDRRQPAARIACRPCRCKSSESLDHLLADAISTALYRC